MVVRGAARFEPCRPQCVILTRTLIPYHNQAVLEEQLLSGSFGKFKPFSINAVWVERPVPVVAVVVEDVVDQKGTVVVVRGSLRLVPGDPFAALAAQSNGDYKHCQNAK